ncbi:TlpA family protein disulfide reductase [Winogradskyella sp. R77965]|uniref:TlpA family protein disulfide reductase n=1 Tax=Winogradskyella sp. R77965 TaxID=3093872 RepID=UPI0037DC2627
MKKLIALCLAISFFGCKKEEPKDYATLSGKIENPHASKTLKVFQGRNYEKIITIADDGTFKDTLKVEAGDYNIQHGDQYGVMYLENDNESTFNTDYENFAKSMVFGGDAEDTNNFSIQSFLISNDYFTEELIANGNQEDLNTAVNNYKSAYDGLKKKYKDVDSTHVALMDQNVEGRIQQLTKFLTPKFTIRNALPKGSVSPSFVDYENYAGGNTSLSDLKGKYVYIDIWATWCGPCIREIPSLKKLEQQFEDKNIEFVSISVDNGRGYKGDAKAAYQGWKKMIADKDLRGTQLFADNGFASQFIQGYRINAIPRFILIDPSGNIVSADAPRPSNPQLVSLFNQLEL